MIDPWEIFLASAARYVHVRGGRQRVIYAINDAAAKRGGVFCKGDRLWLSDASGAWIRLIYENSGQYTKRF